MFYLDMGKDKPVCLTSAESFPPTQNVLLNRTKRSIYKTGQQHMKLEADKSFRHISVTYPNSYMQSFAKIYLVKDSSVVWLQNLFLYYIYIYIYIILLYLFLLWIINMVFNSMTLINGKAEHIA